MGKWGGGQTINLVWLEHRNPFINYPYTQTNNSSPKIVRFQFLI